MAFLFSADQDVHHPTERSRVVAYFWVLAAHMESFKQDLKLNKTELWNIYTLLNTQKCTWRQNGMVLHCFPPTSILVTLFFGLVFNFAPSHQNTFWSEFRHLPKVSGKQKEMTSHLMKKKLFFFGKVLNVILRGYFSDTQFEIKLCC